MAFKILVSVTDDWAIGKNGEMLVRNPRDLKRFKELTTGTTVIMGRKTLESLPLGRPLPNRRNIVLTRDASPLPNGIEVAHGTKDAKTLVKDERNSVWVIGGESVYRTFLPLVDECLVTRCHITRPDADTWFPNLDDLDNWELENTTFGGITPDGIPFDYLTYRRIDKKTAPYEAS